AAGGVAYARSGVSFTLTVTTPTDETCVDVSGAVTGHQTSATAKSSWTFPGTAVTADSGTVETVTLSGASGFNINNQKCTSAKDTGTASYTLDNTAPVVTGTQTPAANGAGWNHSEVIVNWTATDSDTRVAS